MTGDANSVFYRALEASQRATRAIGDPHARADRASEVADAMIATSVLASTRACSAGCASCCHYPVGVSGSELDRIVAWLQRELDGAARAVIRARAALAAAAPKGALARCALLGDDARCVAYPVRPIPCRGWHSTSRDACESAFADGRAASAEFIDRHAFAAALGASAALLDDGETIPLAAALVGRLAPAATRPS